MAIPGFAGSPLIFDCATKMPTLRSQPVGFLVTLLAFIFAGGSATSSAAGRPKWKTYHNTRFNFSVKYLASKWSMYEGFNGSGIQLKPIDSKSFQEPPEMGVGGAVGQPSGDIDSPPQNLKQHFQSLLDAMTGEGHVRHLVVLSKENATIAGLPALVSTIQYEPPSGIETVFTKVILIHAPDDATTYDLTLSCSPTDVSTLAPLFDRMVSQKFSHSRSPNLGEETPGRWTGGALDLTGRVAKALPWALIPPLCHVSVLRVPHPLCHLQRVRACDLLPISGRQVGNPS